MKDVVPIGTRKRRPRLGSMPASRVVIALEDIRGKVQLLLEAVTGLRCELRAEIHALRLEQLSRRIDALQFAVRQNSEDIRSMREQLPGGAADRDSSLQHCNRNLQ